MDLYIFIPLLFGLQAIYWFVGRRSSKNLKGKEDYFLAGKNVSFFPLMMTFLATQVGGGLILGASEEAYHYGWSVIFYPLGAALGLILLGIGTGRKLAEFQVSTIAQILEVVYRSKLLRRVASVLSILSLFMVLVAQILASSKFLVSLGFTSTPLFIAFWAVIILYTAQGGLRAVISTDMVQAAFFSLIFFVGFGFAFFGDPTSSLQSLQIDNFIFESSKICGWLLMPLLFMVVEQSMGQRCFAGKSAKVVSKASLWAGITAMVICTIPIFFGILAKTLGIVVPAGSSVLMTVIESTTGPWVSALVGCAILAAIISTATSLINAISSNLSGDFRSSAFEKKDNVRSVQATTALISIAAIFFAYYFTSVVGLLIQSYELSVSCLFVAVFIGLFKKKGNFLSALLSMVFGGIGFCLFRIFPIDLPREIISILLSLTGFGIGEMISRVQNKNPFVKGVEYEESN